MLLGVWQALAGRAADLVEGRRRLRVWYSIVTAFYGVLVIASEWFWPGGLSAAPLSLANSIGLMGFIFLFAVLGSVPTSEPLALPIQGRQTSPLPNDASEAPPLTGADATQLAALRKLIDHGKVYREPDL